MFGYLGLGHFLFVALLTLLARSSTSSLRAPPKKSIPLPFLTTVGARTFRKNSLRPVPVSETKKTVPSGSNRRDQKYATPTYAAESNIACDSEKCLSKVKGSMVVTYAVLPKMVELVKVMTEKLYDGLQMAFLFGTTEFWQSTGLDDTLLQYSLPTMICMLNKLGLVFSHTLVKGLSSKKYHSLLNKWFNLNGCSVRLPPLSYIAKGGKPKSIVHFVGGFLLGARSAVAYNDLLEMLADHGHIIVVTPIPFFDTNHEAVATLTAERFNACMHEAVFPILESLGGRDDIPIIGLSHSLGCKLTALFSCGAAKAIDGCPTLGSDEVVARAKTDCAVNRRMNIFMAFNNMPFRGNLQLSPTPDETWDRIRSSYRVKENIVLQFSSDNLDQSDRIFDILSESGKSLKVTKQVIPGDHLSPVGSDSQVFAHLLDLLDSVTGRTQE